MIWLRNSLVRSLSGFPKNSSGGFISTISQQSMKTILSATDRAFLYYWDDSLLSSWIRAIVGKAMGSFQQNMAATMAKYEDAEEADMQAIIGDIKKVKGDYQKRWRRYSKGNEF